jgi:hypothetical protein
MPRPYVGKQMVQRNQAMRFASAKWCLDLNDGFTLPSAREAREDR